MRVLACSDLHGDTVALKKILENAERKADVIVMAGDLTAFPKKNEIEIRSVERVLMKFFNVKKNAVARCHNEKIIASFERDKICYDFPEGLAKKFTPSKIRDFGEFGLLKASKTFQAYQSKQLVHILQSLDKCKVPSLIVIGNDDHPSLGKLISGAEKERSNFTNIDNKIVSYQDHFFFGYGGAARKGVKCLNDWGESVCRKEMSKFTGRLKSLCPLIFVSHCPPHKCFDFAPFRLTLTSPTPTLRCFSLTPLKRGGIHIGSHALRKIIQEIQPRYFVCGHSHENGGKTEKIRETTVVNVATAHIHPCFGGRYAIIDTEKNFIEWFKL